MKQQETIKQKAFTLLEVLVALAVLTMGLGTVIKVAGSQASQLAYLKDKTIALWVANNKANEVQLDNWPSTGTSTGHEFMANQEWDWKLKVSNTADKDLRRLDIEVIRANEDGEPVVRFIAFTGKKSNKSAIP
ncbi:MAG: GspI family T2SS minor pseudopilin variant XcpV [Gammaproteobacteria bacterium]|nr:MAG: GspI family T2SS minor pseudopilin variant XcpV [Gammaproteobacteria bacterium]